VLTIDQLQLLLDDIADELPTDFYKQLNGGVVISEETKLHPQSQGARELYILGEYHNQRYGLGRYIVIYHGSFSKLYGYHSPRQQRERLKKLLLHEFTHHLESLAGERGLEIKDAQDLQRYKQGLL